MNTRMLLHGIHKLKAVRFGSISLVEDLSIS